MQLTAFRVTATRIADDYIKDQGLKLKHTVAKGYEVSDNAAYLQGTRDSKKIDVRGRKIEA
jgi:hypothetical protein